MKMSDSIELDFSNGTQGVDIAEHIVSILQGIRFGSIEIVIHDGRIVQIDKHEKFRIKSGSASH
jgi:hypothetical protein